MAAEKNPVLKYELDAEDIITDRVLLRQMIAKQEALEEFIKEHMTAEEQKFDAIRRYLLILAAGVALQALGVDLSGIISLVGAFL